MTSNKHFEKIAEILNCLFSNCGEFQLKLEDFINTKPTTHGVKKIRDGRIELFELEELVGKLANDEYVKINFTISEKEWKIYFKEVEENAKNVAMIVHKQLLQESKENKDCMILNSKPFKNRKIDLKTPNICCQFKYANQASVHPSGSGFFIAENIIATAAHVIDKTKNIKLSDHSINDFRIIPGILNEKNNVLHHRIEIPKSRIYQPVELIDLKYEDNKDWAMMEVEQVFKEYTPSPKELPKPININNRDPLPTDELNPKELLYAIGHGLGQPMKVSFDGKIFNNKEDKEFFECDLTLLHGNSGSPVFYADTHELAGIYMGGMNKLIPNNCEYCIYPDDNNSCLAVHNCVHPFEGQECQMFISIRKIFEKHKNQHLA